MSDLKQYLSLQSRIDELEKEVERLRRSNEKFKSKMKTIHKGRAFNIRVQNVKKDIANIKENDSCGGAVEKINKLSQKNFLPVGLVERIWYGVV